MNQKKVSTILIVCTSLAAVFFVIKQNFNLAVLFLAIMFTLTNFFRARTFKEQGHEKEAQWMKIMSIIFGICSILILVVVIL